MKVSLNWLKELFPTNLAVQDISDRLAQLGFPVAGVEKKGIAVENVITAKILNVEKHPNADRLRIATVSDGKTEKRIVCGAPNIESGQIVPLALPGAELPGGLKIAISSIRGVESAGMLCSERELGLSTEHAGILILPSGTELGKEVKEVLGGNDVVFDIEITPNRSDLLSHVGVVRELAASEKKNFKPAVIKLPELLEKTSKFKISIEDKAKCQRYIGKIIKGVKVQPSPLWLSERLKACGIRPINNVVDITNYVLLEWGHPLHAFDLNLLSGGELSVRLAKENETIKALDGKTYPLSSDDLVIADGSAPVAIAGVMGGEASGVTDQTVDILLESAVFDPKQVRKTSRKCDLKSESSLRFEKGTHPEMAQMASDRAAQLLLELAGGTLVSEIDKALVKHSSTKISVSLSEIENMLNIKIKIKDAQKIFDCLGFVPSLKGSVITCIVPHYRRDIQEPVDLIEELARLIGYEKIPTHLPVAALGQLSSEYRSPSLTLFQETLKGAGISETITHSFCSESQLIELGFSLDSVIRLANPLAKDEGLMRPSLIVNLLKAVQKNTNQQRKSISFFEIGKRFLGTESLGIGIVVSGENVSESWKKTQSKFDFYALKSILELLIKQTGIQLQLKEGVSVNYLHPHQSYNLLCRGEKIGYMGFLHPSVVRSLDISPATGVIEFNLDVALESIKRTETFLPISKFSFVERDIAVLVPVDTKWEKIEKQVQKVSGPLLKHVFPFDVFMGGSLPENEKSIAFRVQLQHADHALSEAEITSTVDSIRQALKDQCGAKSR